MRARAAHKQLLGYGCAVASVAMALMLTLWLSPQVVGLTPLFFAAVMLSAWCGGVGPGLLATMLAGAASAYFFAEPAGSLRIGFDDLIREIIFIAVALLVSYLQASTRRSQSQLRQAVANADAATQAKDRFLAVLSHELRNPLNPVLSAASLYEHDPSLPASVREDFAMIRRNIELEARLIDDLLDLNRITAGKLAMQFQILDVHEILGDAIRVCRDEMAAKQLRLAFDLSAQRTVVSGDAARLRQVFWNLLRNAVKFTPAHGTISLSSIETPDGRIEISVRDTGVGIEPQILSRIFNPFDQGDSRVTREFGGLGLGLAISKMLIETHGGSIRAHSEGKGKGASFIVTIPLSVDGQIDQPRRLAPDIAEAEHRSVRILLVEDHEDTCRIMSKLLRGSRHEVATANSVGSALQVARQGQFDLVIADLGLPDGSGLDLMRQLKEMYNLKGIALTGYGMQEDVLHTREAGFDDHLTKPVDLPRLKAAIQRVTCEAAV